MYYKNGQFKDAKRCNKEKKRIRIEFEIEDGFNIGTACDDLGEVYLRMGMLEEAMKEYQEGLRINRDCQDDVENSTINSLAGIGHVMVAEGKTLQAMILLALSKSTHDEAQEDWERKYTGTWDARHLCYVAAAHLRGEKNALEGSREALKILARESDPDMY